MRNSLGGDNEGIVFGVEKRKISSNFLPFGIVERIKEIALESDEKLYLFHGIDYSIATQLIALSSDGNDTVLQTSVPNDKKRFWDIEKLLSWYNDGSENWKERHFYFICGSTWKLAAIAWLRKSSLPTMKEDAQQWFLRLLDGRDMHSTSIHTEGFRVYPDFRWRKLWNHILAEATNHYESTGNTGVVIWDVDEWNVASQRVHTFAGYINIWHWEAAKTWSRWEERILYAKLI